MKMRRHTQIPGTMLAVMLTLGVASGLVAGPKAQAGDGRGLEGTWLNTVKIVTCPPAPHAVIATIQSMTTYIRGGILLEGGPPATPPPAVSRSAGHGIWERTSPYTFRVFFRAHSFDNLGSHSRRRHMSLKINDLSHSAFVNIKPIKSTTYAF